MGNEYNYNDSYEVSRSRVSGLTKVFLIMLAGLASTAGFSYLFALLFASGTLSADGYLGLIVASSIAILIVSIVTHISSLKENIPFAIGGFAIYTILWGILISSLMIVYEFESLGLAFLCTAGAFGAMAAYGFFAKEKATTLGIISSGLFMGALLMSLVNIFMGSESLYWIISYVILIAMLGITAYDVSRAKIVSDSGNMTFGLAVFFAFQLYVDFIYIFIRIVVMFGKSRN